MRRLLREAAAGLALGLAAMFVLCLLCVLGERF